MTKSTFSILSFVCTLLAIIITSCSNESNPINDENDSDLNYTFSGQDLTVDQDFNQIRYVDLDTLYRYGRLKPFGFKSETIEGTIVVEFKIFGHCCLKPIGTAVIREKHILLEYGLDYIDEYAVCESACDYLFIYKFPEQVNSGKSFKFKKSESCVD